MNRINTLKSKVEALYKSKNPNRMDWADWLFENHVLIVAENAKKLVERFGGNGDLAVAASLLHDIADAIMARENPKHEEQSKVIAREYLQESAFSDDEIKIIVEDAMQFHGCKNGMIPKTLEGKIIATADAVAHLKSNFYDYALETLKKTDSLEEIRNWALPKIERDFRDKIFFDEVRQEVKMDYERVKNLFDL